MPHIEPGWQSAITLAATFGVLAILLRRRRGLAAGLREASLVFGLFFTWIMVGSYTESYVTGALDRGRQLYRFEQLIGLPSELTVQRWLLPHETLSHLVNGYYLFGHLNVMAVLLAWTWIWHRQAYPALRLQVVLLCLSCLLIQLVGVAPPRLLPGLGFVDLANKYGESVYGGLGTGINGQLLAMPSLHVGWAAVAAWTVWRNGARWWRWIGPTHFVGMTLVVVASANHWWLDGIVAVALLAAIIPIVDRILKVGGPRVASAPAVVPEPALSA